MRIFDLLEQWLLKQADQWVDRRPRPSPPPAQLKAARIVAHRGAYDNRRIFENTLAAFERFAAAGGWGIELDVRWTQDGVPVVSHDPDGRRLFGVDQAIAEMDLAMLQRDLPQVPTLSEVVARFGGRLHLMVEIKSLPSRAVRPPAAILQHHFGPLTASRDYHLLSLDPGLLQRLAFGAPQACIPIARINLRNVVQAAQSLGWGGVAGHYALIPQHRIGVLQRRGLRVGTGFVNSPNCLYRELARGVDWLFSDRPLLLQGRVAGGPAADSSSTR
jgi:glycerophosphoryl diester phosphodiesterase